MPRPAPMQYRKTGTIAVQQTPGRVHAACLVEVPGALADRDLRRSHANRPDAIRDL